MSANLENSAVATELEKEHVYLWQIHFDTWQNQYNIVKLNKIKLKKKKRSVFIPIPKKGNAKEYSNYHTIALISPSSKIMLKNLSS